MVSFATVTIDSILMLAFSRHSKHNLTAMTPVTTTLKLLSFPNQAKTSTNLQ